VLVHAAAGEQQERSAGAPAANLPDAENTIAESKSVDSDGQGSELSRSGTAMCRTYTALS
jgi:hypothetical protein